MNKKTIIELVVAIIVIIIAIAGFAIYKQNNTTEENNSKVENRENENTELEDNTNNTDEVNEDDESDENTNTSSTGRKTLVVYYSAQNHTKSVAEKIANNLDADVFEIVPEEIYTEEDLNWTNNNSRVSKEHNDESLRNVKLNKEKVDNWEDYDTVLIGYPIWWGIAAWPVDTFVKANDFDRKTVIPFCTSTSSGLGQSGKLLEEEANGGNWKDGHRFKSNPSDSDIKNWTDSIK